MPKTADNRRLQYALAAGLALLTLALYLPALRNGFVLWDDDQYIVNNLHIRSWDLPLIRWAFTDLSVSYWHPLTWLSHALDYAVWGLNPVGHHLTSILMHAANTFLVVRLVIVLLEAATARARAAGAAPSGDRRSVLIAAGVAGVLFGIHPLHVESVAWVSERKDVLCAFFTLLSVLAYAAHAERRAIPGGPALSFLTRPYFFALVLFLFALMSKPMAVTVPAVLLLLDWYPFGRLRGWRSALSLLGEKIPFLLLSAFVSAVTVRVQQTLGAVAPLSETPLASRLGESLRMAVSYLGKMAVPLHLSPLYPYPEKVSFLSPGTGVSVALVLAVTVGCVVAARKRKVFLAVWAQYLVLLLPVLGIIKVGAVSMADRYTYLPSIAPFLLVGMGAASLSMHAVSARRERTTVLIAGAAAMLLVLCLSWMTVQQIRVWRSSIGLWSRVLAEEPARLPVAYNNRALAYARAGQDERAREDLNAAIALSPGYAEAFMNRGVLNGKAGRCQDALEDLTRAIALRPEGAEAYLNRGSAYECVGDPGRAIGDYTRAIERNPELSPAYLFRGGLLEKSGRRQAAAQDYRTACALGSAEGCDAYRTQDDRVDVRR